MTKIFPKKKRLNESLVKRAKVAVAIGGACFFATMALSSTATAEPTRSPVFDWSRAIIELDQLARTGNMERATPMPGRAPATSTARQNRHDHPTDTYTQNATNTWFGVNPRVSLVARDWGATHRLLGDRLSVVDAMRLTRSARMVMTRVRLSDLSSTRITPFAQLGLGQWRVDTLIMPLTPHSEELAGQIGGGFELHIKRWQIACESTVTAIYREQREANNIPQTRMWSTMLAAKVEF